MKLYTITQSERGKPQGKGGNTAISIKLLVGSVNEQIDAGTVYLRVENGLYIVDYNPPTGQTKPLFRAKEQS